MASLAEFSTAGFARHIGERGHKPVHAARVMRAYYEGNGAADFDALKLPAALAGYLRGFAAGAEIAARQVAEDGTAKVLLRLADGRTVEAVMMANFAADSAAGCVSSQVGCAMGCDFCATTKTGFERNLSAGEMVEQFLAIRREAALAGRKLRTLVFMGMGEPMLNLNAVLEAVRRIASNGMGNLGWRQITVSTVGIVPGIDAMAAADLNIHLAVSLHAPDDATRARLLPAGKRFRVDDILAAADRYQAKSGRIVTIQYCLLKGVNDSPGQARQLAALLKGRRMHANLLRYNPTGISLSGAHYEGSDDAAASAFLKVLREGGAVAHFRRPRGRDIDAACGQLRAANDAGGRRE
ncbi:MAG: 23S rRNA (adenine(2503)-C(2))-methyltransferase RlmN [Opitutaceae bacterium]|jgi:23S rRNA (adenine2503-C2)-methyltransferase|nr:23S rRNA (adenine(2503)-C(2))-methyltransferase RlmN [Opitutaceae bacterium]